MISNAIERAQKKVEENNFGIRKRLLEYDDVMNSQREVIYTRRRHALYGERIEIDLNNILYDYAENFVEQHGGIEFEDFRFELIREVAVEPSFGAAAYAKAKPAELAEWIVKDLQELYARRAKAVADTVRPVMERIYEERKEDSWTATSISRLRTAIWATTCRSTCAAVRRRTGPRSTRSSPRW